MRACTSVCAGVGEMEAGHRRGTLVRARRNTHHALGEKGAVQIQIVVKGANSEWARGGWSPLGDTVSLQESRAKGGCGVGSMTPTPGHVQVLTMAQGQGPEHGAPHSKGAQPQLGHLKARPRLNTGSEGMRKPDSYL